MRFFKSSSGRFLLQFLLIFTCLFTVAVSQAEEESENLPDDQHPCYRPCDGKPKKCHYTFKVEMYSSMSLACFTCPIKLSDCFRPDCVSADGTRRSVFVVNRRIPGTGIHVCEGDTVEVDVENEASPHSTSIHWHGILQHNYQYMDGVPMITQCPIPPFTTFRYKFPVPQSGTYLWHGHSSLQKVDGLFGPLIVRENKDQMKYKYDYDLVEHVIMVNDWYAEAIIEEYIRIEYHHMYTHPRTVLVNGRGRFRNLTDHAKMIFYPPADKFTLDGRGIIQGLFPNETEVFHTPVSTFNVDQGKRYRFRMIGSGVQCAIQVSIEQHPLEIIATDGLGVEPFVVDAFNIATGERYDFILTADKPVANYWMKFRGLEDCDDRTASAYQVAILHYNGAPDEDPPGTPSYNFTRAQGFILNPVTTDNKTMIGSIVMLNSTQPNDRTATQLIPDVQQILEYDYHAQNDTIFNLPIYYQPNLGLPFHRAHPLPLINYIFNVNPPSPLLSQLKDVPQDRLCNNESLYESGTDCSKVFCNCVHLIKIPLNAIVELVLIDYGIFPSQNGNHPMHLHGHHFRVVAMDRFQEGEGINQTTEIARIRQLAKENKLVQKLENAVYKDTIHVPNGGYAVVRFLTDNPGFWLFHCHNDVHMEVGMSLTFQAGDARRFPKPPKNFPTCGHFQPKRKRSFA